MQTAYLVHSIGEYQDVKVHACVGGIVVKEDIRILKQGGIQVVVGTPGRIQDMMKRGFLKTEFLKIIVLDDAEELCSRGFKEQILSIFKYLPGEIQIALFSDTVTPEIIDLTKPFMRDPAKILVKNQELNLDGIH
jgi:translation initiation factor 4A